MDEAQPQVGQGQIRQPASEGHPTVRRPRCDRQARRHTAWHGEDDGRPTGDPLLGDDVPRYVVSSYQLQSPRQSSRRCVVDDVAVGIAERR